MYIKDLAQFYLYRYTIHIYHKLELTLAAVVAHCDPHLPFVERSLDTIIADNQRFVTEGGNVK